jgi:hypothetical protein
MASDSQDKPPLPSYVEISEETRRLIALPLRCETIDGESFISLAMRLAARNGLSGPRELWSSFGLLEWNDTALMRDPLDVVTMSLVSGETHERIASLSPVWVERTGNFREWDPGSYFAQLSGQSLEFRDFAQTRRVCPACIAESPHEPLLWRVDALAGCLKHGTLFITACICGRKLDWSGHVNVCPDCGVQLGSLASDPMPAADVDVTEYVMGRFLGEKDAPCAWLNGRNDPLGRRRRRSRESRHSTENVLRLRLCSTPKPAGRITFVDPGPGGQPRSRWKRRRIRICKSRRRLSPTVAAGPGSRDRRTDRGTGAGGRRVG